MPLTDTYSSLHSGRAVHHIGVTPWDHFDSFGTRVISGALVLEQDRDNYFLADACGSVLAWTQSLNLQAGLELSSRTREGAQIRLAPARIHAPSSPIQEIEEIMTAQPPKLYRMSPESSRHRIIHRHQTLFLGPGVDDNLGYSAWPRPHIPVSLFLYLTIFHSGMVQW